MKKIIIYLVAEEIALLQDKREISNFIRDLNDKYEDYGIYFKLMISDNIGIIQEDEIKQSEFFFILFYKEASKTAIDKFNVAYENFKKYKNPKIATYIKKDSNLLGDSMKEFAKKLDEELGHYYNIYENIDTIKLNVILQLNSLGLDLVTIKDDKIYIGEKETMTLEKIPMLINNEYFKRLKEEYKQTEKEFWDIKRKIRDNPDDEEIFEQYVKIKEKREKIKDNIYHFENDIVNLESDFIRGCAEGNVSQRQLCARKYLEEGNLEEAKKVLNFKELKQDGDRMILLQQKRKEEIRVIINEFIQRVNTLKLDIKNLNRFQEIETTFEEAIRIEKEGGLKRTTLDTYMLYLERQRKYKKLKEIATLYLNYLEMENYVVSPKVYVVLGECYREEKNYSEAEKFFLESIKSLKKLVKENPRLYERRLGVSYNNIGLMYREIQQYNKAEEYMKRDIDIAEKVAKENFELYGPDLATIYSNMAGLYQEQKKLEEAIKYYLKAREIAEKLSMKKVENRSVLAIVYENIGLLYQKNKQYEEAEKYFLKSLKITKEIVMNNIEIYEEDLKDIYNCIERLEDDYADIAEKYFLEKNYPSAEEYFSKCINLAESYTKENSQLHMANLSTYYYNISMVYSRTGKYKKAVDYLMKSLKEREKLAKENPEKYERKLGNVYNNLASAYEKSNEPKNALLYYEKTIKIYEKNNVEKDVLKERYFRILNLCEKLGENEKAKKYKKKYNSCMD